MLVRGYGRRMAVTRYWLVRTALFLAVYLVLWWLRWFDIFAVLVAFVIAWLLGYILFPKMRVAAQLQMDGWISRGQRGIEADADEEDAERARLEGEADSEEE